MATHIGNDEIIRLTEACWPTIQQRESPAYQMATFGLLCAHFGGEMNESRGDINRSLRYAGEMYAGWYGIPNPSPAPEPAPGSGVVRGALRVEDNRRWFCNDAGRFDFREVSAFSLLGRLLKGEDAYVRDWLSEMRGYGFTVARVICTLDGNYWRDFRTAPDMPGYWEAVDRLCQIAGEVGIYLRLCLLGAVEPFGGTWYPDRRDVWSGDVRRRGEEFAVEFARRVAHQTAVIVELANEPGQIGLRDSFDELIELGYRVKEAARDRLLNAGASDGPNDGDTRFCRDPFDFLDAHLERRMAVGGMEWVKRSGEYPSIDQERVQKRMPFVSGEPVNFGEWRADGHNGDVERNPSVAFCYGGVSRARQYNTNFHFDGGLWTTPPEGETVACIQAYHAALNAFPMQLGTKWRGHWAESYWRQVWPGTDDARDVERHVADGRGPWRVFGCGAYSVTIAEPRNWDWRGAVNGGHVERLAHAGGYFDSAVYVRR